MNLIHKCQLLWCVCLHCCGVKILLIITQFISRLMQNSHTGTIFWTQDVISKWRPDTDLPHTHTHTFKAIIYIYIYCWIIASVLKLIFFKCILNRAVLSVINKYVQSLVCIDYSAWSLDVTCHSDRWTSSHHSSSCSSSVNPISLFLKWCRRRLRWDLETNAASPVLSVVARIWGNWKTTRSSLR